VVARLRGIVPDWRGRGILRWAAVLVTALLIPASASAYSASWKAQAACIRHFESGNNWRLELPKFAGAYSFARSTWASFKPRRWPLDPAKASPAQQTLVAWRIYVANGHRWGGNQWPNSSRACGVR
jgi:hypothetical protein